MFDIISPIARPDYVRERHYLRQFFSAFEPALVARLNRMDPQDFDTTSTGRCTTYVDDYGTGYEIAATQWMESIVRVDLNGGKVTKSLGPKYAGFGIWEREIEWLRRLQPTGIAAELLHATPTRMTTRYAGEPVSEFSLPYDWREQAERILAVLAEHGCAHNDIAAANIVVADGQLRLIDFAWALPIGSPVPPDWPLELGRHKLANHQFDDRHALFEALGEKELIARSLTEQAQ